MRPQKVSDRDLIDKLFTVIRANGYEGASINELADYTGLKKASLYHRYPGGKEEIVKAVLKDINDWSEKHVAGILESPNLDADTRLEAVLSNISALYSKGKKNCIFSSLALGKGLDLFGQDIKTGLRIWTRAFTTYGQSIGLTRLAAEKKADEAMVIIQGSLVVCRIMDDKTTWDKALDRVKELYNYY